MHILNLKSTLTVFAFALLTTTLIAQEKKEDSPIHIKIKRLNDSYFDVYHNKASGNRKLPLLIFCQGSGYDSNSKGFLGLLHQFDKKAVGVAIEKEGVKFGDKGDTLRDQYKQNNTIFNRL